MKHCCNEMTYHLNEGEIGIDYTPKLNSYSLEYKGDGSRQRIRYCPWCGAELPDFSDRWSEEIEALGFYLGDPGIPKKYQTDEWWSESK